MTDAMSKRLKSNRKIANREKFFLLISFLLFMFFIRSFCYYFRAPLSARGNNPGLGSECSLPPSYRARNNLPHTLAATGSSSSGQQVIDDTPNTNNSSGNQSASLVNVYESPSVSNKMETRAIITSANQRHQQQQSRRLDTLNSVSENSSTIPTTEENAMNNVKVSRSSTEETRTGILNGALFSQSSNVKGSPSTLSTMRAAATVASSMQSKLCRPGDDLHDIGRLFLNANHTISDNGINTDNMQVNALDDQRVSRKDLVTIVTISGCTTSESTTGEMDILAHL